MHRPQVFVPVFQLEGVPGWTAIAGYGILFLMWQVPYVFALLQPVSYLISLRSALIMQTIGVVAESMLLSTIPLEYALLRGSILRFILFDGAGVLILLDAIRTVKDPDLDKTRS